MLDENRGRSQLAARAGVAVEEVRDLAIWGNHSSTQFPDFYHATIGGRPAAEVIADEAWLQGEFISHGPAARRRDHRGTRPVERGQRGQRGDRYRSQHHPAERRDLQRRDPGTRPTAATGSRQGSSSATRCAPPRRATVEIEHGIVHNAWAQGKVDATLAELLEEREAVMELIG